MHASIRRGALALAVAALSAGAAPVAAGAAQDPSVVVCNQASPHWLGDGLVALDPPTDSPAARYTVDIGKLPSSAAGLLTAAASSPSLTVCGPAGDGGGINVTVVDPVTNDGANVGDGVIAVT